MVESPTVVWPGAAPRLTRAISSPRVSGRSYQRSSQPRIRRVPHSSSTKARSRSPVTASGRPERVAVEVDEEVSAPTNSARWAASGSAASSAAAYAAVVSGWRGRSCGSLLRSTADRSRCRPRSAAGFTQGSTALTTPGDVHTFEDGPAPAGPILGRESHDQHHPYGDRLVRRGVAMAVGLSTVGIAPATAAPGDWTTVAKTAEGKMKSKLVGETSTGRKVTGSFTPKRFVEKNGKIFAKGVIRGDVHDQVGRHQDVQGQAPRAGEEGQRHPAQRPRGQQPRRLRRPQPRAGPAGPRRARPHRQPRTASCSTSSPSPVPATCWATCSARWPACSTAAACSATCWARSPTCSTRSSAPRAARLSRLRTGPGRAFACAPALPYS